MKGSLLYSSLLTTSHWSLMHVYYIKVLTIRYAESVTPIGFHTSTQINAH